MKKINSKNKQLLVKDGVCDAIKNSEAKVVVMMGAGDIGVLVEDVVTDLRLFNNEV